MRLPLVALMLCVVPAARADDNPFRKTKVGDWVEYQMSGPNMSGRTKMTVTAKDDKELVYQVTGTFSYMGSQMAAPVQTLKIDLTKSYDPVVAANLRKNNVTVTKEGEGTEKIKSAGREYDTRWTKSKSVANTGGVTVVTDSKMWFADNVPLSGMVRMEMTTAGTVTRLDLVGVGQ